MTPHNWTTIRVGKYSGWNCPRCGTSITYSNASDRIPFYLGVPSSPSEDRLIGTLENCDEVIVKLILDK